MATWRNLGVCVALLLSSGLCQAQSHRLTEESRPGDCHKYDLEMTLKGELRVSRDGKTVPIAISASAKHAFTERILEAKEKSYPEKAARYYSLARSDATLESQTQTRQIRGDRRLIVAQRPKDEFLCYSPAGPMTREELEVVSEHFDTLTLTGILPTSEVKVGDSWKLPNETVQAFCQFEALISNELTVKLEEVAEGFATFSIGGKASGIELGSLAKLTVSGRAKYEVLPRKLVSVEWTQKDERDQGPASPAATLEATTIVKRSAIEQPKELSDSALESIPRGFEVPQALALIYHQDIERRYDVATSRDWRLVAQTEQHLVLRLIDRGELVAQAALMAWTKVEPGKHSSIESFKEATANAPGWQQEEVLEANEIPSDNGRWIYRIAARGAMDDVKVVQTFYLIAAPDGQQVVITFTMKPGQAAKLGSRDLTLVGSVGFPRKK